MKNIFLIFLFLVPAARAQENSQLQARLEKVIAGSGLKKSDLGMYVVSEEGQKNEVIFDLNSKKKMTPASITKIVTASAVLDAFAPGTKLKTALYLQGKQKGKVFSGDIYLKGGGDPSFVSENMWYLVNAFKRTGIESITGDIIVDDSLFDSVRYDESRQDARVDRAYDAPVGAMSFNWNSINVFVRAGEPGEKAKVFLDPENVYTSLVNNTKSVGGSVQSIAVDRDQAKYGDKLLVTGHIGEKQKEVVVYKNITKPDIWSGENLRSFLKERGIEVAGQVRNGNTPASANLAAESESKPIEHILADMNKFSNNYVAEMLCKLVGTTKTIPAKMTDGMGIIQKHMEAMGVPKDQFELFNPSGLTTDNKMSPYSLSVVLSHLHKEFREQPEFLTSLPIAGIDGTLKKRMKNSPAERWVRAKTGLLTGVVALAGYAGRKDGRVFHFVFIYNGAADGGRVRDIFDSSLVELVR